MRRGAVVIAGAVALWVAAGCAAGQSGMAVDGGADDAPLVDERAADLPMEPPPDDEAPDVPAEPPYPVDAPMPPACTAVEGMHTCANPVKVPAEGGEFCGDTRRSVNFYGLATDRLGQNCSELSYEPDYVFEIRSADEFDLTVAVTSDWQAAVYLRTSCANSATQIACDEGDAAGATVGFTLGGLSAGTYYLFVDGRASSVSGAGANRGPFRLRVDLNHHTTTTGGNG
jgi:hypothetical protein